MKPDFARRTAEPIVPSFKQRIAGLDEWRGIAILLVVLCHGRRVLCGDFRFSALSYIGVNIFFVISGYLICTILTKSRGEPDFFRTFYVRRIFRIWPLYLLIMSFGLLAGLFQGHAILNALPYYLTFTVNFVWDRSVSEAANEPSLLLPFTSPMWSLAIEEQFYILLPFLVYWMRPHRLRIFVVLVCVLSAIAATWTLFSTYGDNAVFVYSNLKNTALRIHYISLGVLLAMRPRLAYIALICWVAASTLLFRCAGLFEGVIAFLIVFVIDFTVHKKPIFTNRPLAKIGLLCYGIYLIHWPILRVLERGVLPHTGRSSGALAGVFVLFVAASLILAKLSFRFFEDPIQRLRVRYEKKRCFRERPGEMVNAAVNTL